MAELRTFPPPPPQSSRGQRKAITSLVFVAAQHEGGKEGGEGVKGP